MLDKWRLMSWLAAEAALAASLRPVAPACRLSCVSASFCWIESSVDFFQEREAMGRV
jgi:hypothetical protein